MDRVPFPFVAGSVRSGTTMLRLMLNRHPELAVPGEAYFPVRLWPYRQKYLGPDGFDMHLLTDDLLENPALPDFRDNWGLDPEHVRRELPRRRADDYPDAIRRVYELYAEAHGKPRYGNKTPVFVRRMALLAEMFPEATFVHLIRDGRDVVTSMLEQAWGPTRLTDAAALWKRLVEEGTSTGARLGSQRYLEIRYEDLVTDPESTLERVCSHIGLDPTPEMLRYHEDALDHLPPRVHHLDQNLTWPPTPGLRDWRRDMDPADLETFEAIAGDLLEHLGYETRTLRGAAAS
jgi:hypothetical protein